MYRHCVVFPFLIWIYVGIRWNFILGFMALFFSWWVLTLLTNWWIYKEWRII